MKKVPKSALLTWSGMQIRPPVFGDEWIRGWKGVQLLPDLQTVILCVSACVIVSSPGLGGALQGRWDWLGCQFWTLAQLQSRLGRPSHRCHFGSHLCLQKIRIEQVQVHTYYIHTILKIRILQNWDGLSTGFFLAFSKCFYLREAIKCHTWYIFNRFANKTVI